MQNIKMVVKLSLALEQQLRQKDLLTHSGNLSVSILPPELEQRFDGLIENKAELEALLRIARAVREGGSISAPVAAAMRIMLEGACHVLRSEDVTASERGDSAIHMS